MKTGIIIITHKRPQKLWTLLNTIKTHTPEQHNIYILDNGATLNSKLIDKIKHEHGANIFTSKINLYPGQARNFLFDKLQDEACIVTLDDDMRVTKGWLTHLLELARRTSNCGGIAPRIIQEDGNVIHSQGGSYAIKDGYITFQEHFRMRPHTKSDIELECDWLASGCSLYPRHIIEKFRFDENLPNMEDPVHSYDIKIAGYKLMSTAKSEVIHSKGLKANADLRSNENIIKSICYIHHKYNLNPIKSWSMDKRLFRGRKFIQARVDQWLTYHKAKLNIISADMTNLTDPMIARPPRTKREVRTVTSNIRKQPLKKSAVVSPPRSNRLPASYEYLKKKK